MKLSFISRLQQLFDRLAERKNRHGTAAVIGETVFLIEANPETRHSTSTTDSDFNPAGSPECA